MIETTKKNKGKRKPKVDPVHIKEIKIKKKDTQRDEEWCLKNGFTLDLLQRHVNTMSDFDFDVDVDVHEEEKEEKEKEKYDKNYNQMAVHFYNGYKRLKVEEEEVVTCLNVEDKDKDDKNKCKEEKSFKKVIQLQLPLFLSRSVWERYVYTIEDIQKTLKYFKAFNLWPLCLLENLSVSINAVKIGYSDEDELICGQKSAAIKVLINKLKSDMESSWMKNKIHALVYRRCKHSPSLPVERVDEEVWKYFSNWMNTVASESSHTTPTMNPNHYYYNNKYTSYAIWKNIKVIPLYWEVPNILIIQRVEHPDIYYQYYNKPTCLTEEPTTVIIGGQIYCNTLECFYMVHVPTSLPS
jgi:hypothetical protein